MDGGAHVERRNPAAGATTPATFSRRVHYQPLVIVFTAAAIGMSFDRYGQHPAALSSDRSVGWFWGVGIAWTIAALGLVAWFGLWRNGRDRAAAWVLLGAVALLAAAWHHLNWYTFGHDEVGRFATVEPGPACLEVVARTSPARVSAPPPTPLRAIPIGERSRLVVDVIAIRDGKSWRPASGHCQLSLEGHLLGVGAGDALRVFGQLSRPAPPLNPGEFDFAEHARADGELARIRSSAPDCVVKLAAGSAWSPAHWLDELRTRAKAYVSSMIGPRRAGLAAAVLLGAREGLPFEATEPYLETGTVHVLVVSGMNVAILAMGLVAMMRLGVLPRKIGLALVIAVVVAYVFLTDIQPPVVRAAVVAVLLCLAAWGGRRGVAFNSLFAAALFVMALNPNDLFRAGPQLSFLAVAALIWVASWKWRPLRAASDPLERLIESARPWHERTARWSIRGGIWLLVMSTAVWLVTLPLVLSRFHIAPLIAVIVSPIVSGIVWLTMWTGFLMIAVGWAFAPVGRMFGALCDATLGWLEHVVAWAEAIPAGHFWAPGPAWWWVAVFYVALILVMVRGNTLLAPRWQLAALAGWILVGLAPPFMKMSTRGGIDCSIVAVGHGACVVMQTPDGKTLLYDAGAIGSPESATQTIASYLWRRGIMRIDGIVISHADIDHYNAVPGLIERFGVGAVYVSPVMFSGFGQRPVVEGVEVLRESIERAGVPIREIWAGDRLQVAEGVTINVLYPPRRGVVGSDNANSLALAVEHGERRMLLPGDLESPGMEDLLAEEPYDCDILLAPHHGSRRSDPPGFAAWSTPEWVVISGGGGDDIGTVEQTYQRGGAIVLATNDVGTVEFHWANGEPLTVRPWRKP